MLVDLEREIQKGNTLAEVSARVLSVLFEIKRNDPNAEIAFVSGPVTKDGEEYIARNLERLREYSESIRQKHFKYAFSAGDVFSVELIDKFIKQGSRNDDALRFWEILLRSRHITHIIFTPGSESSPGSKAERGIAHEVGMRMHSINEGFLLSEL